MTDPAGLAEFSRVTRDFRALATKLVIDHFDTALHRRLTFCGPGAPPDDGQWPARTH